MNRTQAIILSVCGVILVGLALYLFVDGKPSPAALATKALSASNVKDREHAALELVLLGPAAKPALLRLVKESKDPEVLCPAFVGLTTFADVETLPLYIAALNHEDRSVRDAALPGLLRFYGGKLPDNLDYSSGDEEDARKEVMEGLNKHHEKYLKDQIERIKETNEPKGTKGTKTTPS